MGAYGSKRFKEDLEALRRNDPTLQVLNYEEAGIGDEGARALAEALQSNRTLKRLRLGQCGLSALGLQRICRALCDTSVTPCHLRRLELCTASSTPPVGNAVGDDGAKCLAALISRATSLRHLNAGDCGIGDEGASSIAKALVKNKTLKTLDLSYNSISDIGAEELGSALCANHTLLGLSLWNNRIFHSGAEALANGLAANTSLTWLGLGCNHVGDEGVKAIAIALLSNAHESKLVWLALGGNQVTDRGTEHLGVALRAQQCERKQRNSQTEGSMGDGVSSSSQTSLKERIRAGGLRSMLELGVTPSHISVMVEEEEEEGDKGGEHMEREEEGEEEEEGGKEVFCIPLESLGLGGNKISDLGARHLAEGLASNTRLVSLGLADNHIGDDGAAALADLIRQTDSLHRLILSGNEVGDEGGSKLVAALSQNRSLKGLYLAENPFGDVVGDRCLEVIGRHNNTLETLDVHNSRMTTPAINNLVESMRREGVLRSLGSQALSVGMATTDIESRLPLSGNVLEMENWRPQTKYDPMLNRKNKRFTTTAPSNRQTTVEALGSLPPPVETAQTLVMKAGMEREGTLKRRHTSVSKFLRRKLSRNMSGKQGQRDVVQDIGGEVGGSHRRSWTPSGGGEPGPRESWRLVGGEGGGEGEGGSKRQSWRLGSGARKSRLQQPIELQPLIEDAADEVDSSVFRSPTMVVGETEFPPTAEHRELQAQHSLEQGQEESDLEHSQGGEGREQYTIGLRSSMGMGHSGDGMGPKEDLRHNDMRMGSSQTPTQQYLHDPELDSIERGSSLRHLTTERPKPPANRRSPSRGRSTSPSPSPSPAHNGLRSSDSEDGTLDEEERGEGGGGRWWEGERGGSEEEKEPFQYDVANRMMASATPIHSTEERLRKPSMDSKPLKEQWMVALRMRAGMLKMGGFLHSGFDAIMSADTSKDYNYTIARLPRNHSKCRADAPLPPAHSRVKLQLVFEEVGSDFINASYLGRPAYPQELIVTQVPLESTVSDFWRMIWEQRISVIMVLGDVKGECEGVKVWPAKGDSEGHPLVVSGNWEPEALTVGGIREYAGTIPSLTVHQFSLTSAVDQETDYVQLYHYSGWPEQGVPQSPADVARLVHLLLLSRQQQQVAAPVCIMSPHGGGRAGCVCAVSVAYELMTSPEPEPQCWEMESNILDQVIRGLRRERGGMVGSQRQYEFLHRVLEEMIWGRATEAAEETDGGKKKAKKKSKQTRAEKKEQKRQRRREREREKEEREREKKVKSLKREKPRDRGRQSLLEDEGPNWTEGLHSQMMY